MGNGQTISVANEGELLLLVKRSLPSRGGGRGGGGVVRRERELEPRQTHRQTQSEMERGEKKQTERARYGE